MENCGEILRNPAAAGGLFENLNRPEECEFKPEECEAASGSKCKQRPGDKRPGSYKNL